MNKQHLDDVSRIHEIQDTIARKPALRQFYADMYSRYQRCLDTCPKEGIALELGSGGGFLKQVIPEIVTSDVLAYPNVDQVVSGTAMPFENESLRAIFMLNVFHHIPDVGAFLSEAQRCLKPGGKILIIDQNMGWFSKPIYKYLHHEPMDIHAQDWKFETTGPLSGANQALAWVVFRRDLKKFETLFPKLQLLKYQPHTPLRYWLSGGLKSWTLIPPWANSWVTTTDRLLVKLVPSMGSFVDIEIRKI